MEYGAHWAISVLIWNSVRANISDFSSARSIIEPFAQAYSLDEPKYANNAAYGVPVVKNRYLPVIDKQKPQLARSP